MKNSYAYINTVYSELETFNFEGGLQFGATEFNYDFTNIATKTFGVNANVIFETNLDGEETDILKCQSNFVITRNKEILGEELYSVIKHSILAINVFLREKYLLLQIPSLEVPCPSLDEMKDELDGLAADLNQELK